MSKSSRIHWMLARLSYLVVGCAIVAPAGASQAACVHPTESAPMGLVGDVNGSGSVNVADTVCILHEALIQLAGTGDPPPSCMGSTPRQLADIDCGLDTTIADGLLSTRLVLIGAFPMDVDTNQDLCANNCLVDGDADGIADIEDICPNDPDPTQADMDGNGLGNACDADIDGDGVMNGADNCPLVVNVAQDNGDGDGEGDACDLSCSTGVDKSGWSGREQSWWLQTWGNTCDGKAANLADGGYSYNGGNWAACQGPVSPRSFYAPAYPVANVGQWFELDFGAPTDVYFLTLSQARPDVYVSGMVSPSKFTALLRDATVTFYAADGTAMTPMSLTFPERTVASVAIPSGAYATRVRVQMDSFYGTQPNPSAFIFELDITESPQCAVAYEPSDLDGDGVPDPLDPFPGDASEWADADGDGEGDNSDPDDDNDGIPDGSDLMPTIDLGTADTDGDSIIDALDPDSDNDGTPDTSDPFPFDATETADADADGVGDNSDNCPAVANADQADSDGDGLGNACDNDADQDGVADGTDNCPAVANPGQADGDGDGAGDSCDLDCTTGVDKTGWSANQSSWWLQTWGNTCDGKAANLVNGLYEFTSGNWAACQGPLSPRNFYAPAYPVPNVGQWFEVGFGEPTEIHFLTLTQFPPNTYVSGMVAPAKYTALLRDATLTFYAADGSAMTPMSVTFPQSTVATVSIATPPTARGVRIEMDSFWGSQPNPSAFILELDITESQQCSEPFIPTDTDGDGVPDSSDAFPFDGSEWADNDGDGQGDNSDPDDDNDGIVDGSDASPNEALPAVDTDGDGTDDALDPDIDGDGTDNVSDAFPFDATETTDSDNDGVGDNSDNCPADANSSQADSDGDGIGNACDSDTDGDGVADTVDNCPFVPNGSQADGNSNGAGDACDLGCASGTNKSGWSADQSSWWLQPWGNTCDGKAANSINNLYEFSGGAYNNCLGPISPRNFTAPAYPVPNIGQWIEFDFGVDTPVHFLTLTQFAPNTYVSGMVSPSKFTALLRDATATFFAADGSTLATEALVFPNSTVASVAVPGSPTARRVRIELDSFWGSQPNPSLFLLEVDITESTQCAVAYTPPDSDGDGVSDENDAFPDDPNEWSDTDGDLIGDNADPDDDNDGIPDGADAEPFIDFGGVDTDGDGIPDAVDPDNDNDGTDDVADAFPFDATETTDSDSDGVGDNSDNCPTISNSNQADSDGDGSGNVCDNDGDGDGVADSMDNCPFVPNASQTDGDGDGAGDACDLGCATATNKSLWSGDQQSWWLQPWGNSCDGKAGNLTNNLYEFAGGNYNACTGDISPRNFYAPAYPAPNVGQWFEIDFGADVPIHFLTLTQAAPNTYVSGAVSPAKFTALLRDATVTLYAGDGSTIATESLVFPEATVAPVAVPGAPTARRVRVTMDSFWGSQPNPSAFIFELDITDAPNCATPYLPPDADGDGVSDESDAFPKDASEWADNDGDGAGDNEDPDDDNDGIDDVNDPLPFENLGDTDTDGDGTADAYDTDDDNDGVLDVNDAFPFDATESTDGDGDGVGDNSDNCPAVANANQTDTDGDGVGDACQPSVPAGSTDNPLDALPSATAGLSLRRLTATYTGSAIRVVRSTDSVEQDIGFDANGGLDLTALTAFCGSATCTVSTWYDQTGNGRNFTQSDSAAQPTIVDAGALVSNAGRPTLRFESDWMASGNLHWGTEFTMSLIHGLLPGGFAASTGSTDYYRIVETDFNNHFYLGSNLGNTEYKAAVNSPSAPHGLIEGGTPVGSALRTLSSTNANGDADLWVDGVQVAEEPINVLTSMNHVMYINRYFAGGAQANGDYSELVWFNTPLSDADRSTLEVSQRCFYGAAGGTGGECGVPTGLMAQWELDGDGLDVSGNGFTLTFEGGGQGFINNSPTGQALELSGGYARATGHGGFDIGQGPFTVELWVRPDGPGDSFNGLVGDGDYFNGTSPGWSLGFRNNGIIDFLAGFDGTTVDKRVLSSGGALPFDGNWHHVAVVRTSSLPGGTALYADGVLVGTGRILDFAPSNFDLRIGRWGGNWNSTQYPLSGDVDRVRISGSALSPNQFLELDDNCPGDNNPDQADGDGDGYGDVCDNCPFLSNPDQLDSDGNGTGDVCEPTGPTGTGIGVVAASRAGANALDPAAGGVYGLKTWLNDTANNGLGVPVTALTTIDATTLADIRVLVLVNDGQSTNPTYTAAERQAIANWVDGGGSLVLYWGYTGTDTISAPFGFTLGHVCTGSGTATAVPGAPAQITNGPYGMVTSISWGSNCHESITYGSSGMTEIFDGSTKELSWIPPGTRTAEQGPVFVFMDFNNTYNSGNGVAFNLSRNVIFYASENGN